MKSLLSKSWLGITSLVLIILLLTWLFQVGFLNEFYVNERKNILLKEGNKISSFFTETDNYNNISQQIIDEIESWESSYNARIIITDPKGKLIFYNVPRQFFRDYKISPERFKKSILDSYNDPEILSNLLKGKTFTIQKESSRPNRKSIIVGVPIIKDKEIVGNIIITSPLAPIEETISILKKQLSIITFISLLIGSILALLFAKYFTKPILKITETARKIAKGDFSANVQLNLKDEIGTLGDTINNMAKQLGQIEGFRREFIANTSHELKTPISLIRAYSELVKDNINEINENTEYLQIIIDESKRLNSMVEDILYLSKMESGYYKLDLEKFSLEEVINNVIDKLSFFASKKNIEFNFKINEDKISIYGDKQKIHQVIYNIVNNAINHSFDNGQVTIRIIHINNLIRVEIIDNGIGIPKEDLPYIWDRFYKVDKSRKRESSGSGLGMAIVKNILKAHNYSYGIESETNKGTKVWFEVPKSR
ncbi:ATP-binding protein [Maledivibacter halophilus]|uniref:histidine kinase n=1 Tax=Maledivibacter halophilus TaxID=36842 RepID=A0A1T5J7U8_9FIRM|nr:ATP-binding protein [Maledivibacter halophilus]SKC47495.1 Signal transduction histidine kinase [Maledivibacter halophilus]